MDDNATVTRKMNFRGVPWTAVITFISISFGLMWLANVPEYQLGGAAMETWYWPICLFLGHFSAAIAALLVVFFVHRPRPKHIGRYLGLWPVRPLRGIVRLSGMAFFFFLFLDFASPLLAGAFGWAYLGPIRMQVLQQILPTSLFIVGDLIYEFGEELGWRGWLMPALMPLGTWPTLIITGVIWGLWHTPLILLGAEELPANALGIAIFTGSTVVLGILVGWLRLRSCSVWPAVFAHGSIDIFGNLCSLFTPDAQTSYWMQSSQGVPGVLIMIVVIIGLVVTRQFEQRSQLAPSFSQI